MVAEVRSLHQGIPRCTDEGINCIDIEADSMVQVQILKKKSEALGPLGTRLRRLCRCLAGWTIRLIIFIERLIKVLIC